MVEQRDIDIIMESPIDWEKFRDKSVLVTGATGRLGMYIVEALCKADIDWNLNMQIVALARSQEKLTSVFRSTLDFPNVYTCVQDITSPISWKGKADYIFHTAGLASPVDFTHTPVDTLWGHVAGTHNILEFAREKNTERVFYVSTVEIYGDWQSDERIRESSMGGAIRCDRSRSCYPEAKRLCETMLASYAEQYGLEYTGVRLCHTLGPGISLNDGRAFAEFLQNVIDGKDIVLHSDGSAMRTYTYVADAVGAMLLVATKGENREFYNVASVENIITIKELAHLIAELDVLRRVSVRIEQAQKESLKYLPYHLAIMDIEKVKRLGWTPKVDLKTTFRYTLESFLARTAQ